MLQKNYCFPSLSSVLAFLKLGPVMSPLRHSKSPIRVELALVFSGIGGTAQRWCLSTSVGFGSDLKQVSRTHSRFHPQISKYRIYSIIR